MQDNDNKHLNFMIYGVARSGTSALVRALNKSPYIFCGMELFKMNIPRTHIKLGSFDNPEFTTPNVTTNMKSLSLKNKDKLLYLGDKMPRYFIELNRNEEHGTCKFLFIFRDMFQVMSSWNVRAADASDERWSEDRVGIFALMDMLIALYESTCYKQSSDIILVPYHDLFYGDYELVFKTLDRFLPEKQEVFNQQFLTLFQEFYNNQELLKKKLVLREEDRLFYKKFQVEAIVNCLHNNNLKNFKLFTTELLSQLQAIPHEAFEYFHEYAKDEHPKYYGVYLKQTPQYQRIRKALSGSSENLFPQL